MWGVRQDANFQSYNSEGETVSTASASFTNSSSGSILATASATANAYDYALASGSATGVEQIAYANNGVAKTTVDNAGSISATMNAVATGTYAGSEEDAGIAKASSAVAKAFAAGVEQDALGTAMAMHRRKRRF